MFIFDAKHRFSSEQLHHTGFRKGDLWETGILGGGGGTRYKGKMKYILLLGLGHKLYGAQVITGNVHNTHTYIYMCVHVCVEKNEK